MLSVWPTWSADIWPCQFQWKSWNYDRFCDQMALPKMTTSSDKTYKEKQTISFSFFFPHTQSLVHEPIVSQLVWNNWQWLLINSNRYKGIGIVQGAVFCCANWPIVKISKQHSRTHRKRHCCTQWVPLMVLRCDAGAFNHACCTSSFIYKNIFHWTNALRICLCGVIFLSTNSLTTNLENTKQREICFCWTDVAQCMISQCIAQNV